MAVRLASRGQTWVLVLVQVLGAPAGETLISVIDKDLLKLCILRKKECLSETCCSGLSYNCDSDVTFVAITHLVTSQPGAAFRAAPRIYCTSRVCLRVNKLVGAENISLLSLCGSMETLCWVRVWVGLTLTLGGSNPDPHGLWVFSTHINFSLEEHVHLVRCCSTAEH